MWGEKENSSVKNKDLNRLNEFSGIEVYGAVQLIADSDSPFRENDQGGCLIDDNTAYKLFGSKQVIGKQIIYNQRELTIRGILKNAEDTILMRPTSESKDILNTVSLQSVREPGLSDVEQAFMERHGINGQVFPFGS